MDDAGKMEFTPYEVLFTVKENPLSVPNGILSLGHLRRDEEAESKEPSLSVIMEGNDLHVKGLMNYVCGMDHYIYYEVNGDSVKLETIQAGYFNRRDCNGLHPVDLRFPTEVETNAPSHLGTIIVSAIIRLTLRALLPSIIGFPMAYSMIS